MFQRLLIGLSLIIAALVPGFAQEPTQGYAPVRGLDIYYEIHGSGEPLVLLHGAYMSIDTNWAAFIPALAEHYEVVAVELQGHGRTNDTDRPITYEGMADDVAGLLDHLDIGRAHVFGFSMGGGVGLQLAIRHPERVERLVVASASYTTDGLAEGYEEMVAEISPDWFIGTPLEAEYRRLSPTPDRFVEFVEKLIALEAPFSWPEEEVAAIEAPTLLISGDADIVPAGHMAELYRLMGGTENGDINGLTTTQLMVLPGTTHVGVVANAQNVEIMKTVVPAFLAADLPPDPPQF